MTAPYLVLALDVAILVLAGVLGVLWARVQTATFDVAAHPEALRRRREQSLPSAPLRRALSQLSEVLGKAVLGMGFVNHFARVRRMLLHSGNPGGFTDTEFVGFGLGIGMLTAAAVMAFGLLTSGSLSVVVPLLSACGVYWIRLQQLQAAVDRRRVETGRQLPYLLDLLAMSMSAGATFLNACRTIAGRKGRGAIEEEVRLLLQEVEGGVVLRDALVNTTKRTECEDFVTALMAIKQGDELGTPLVDILRRQAELNRFVRSQRGEQAAAKLPNRLAVPTTFLMMAVMLLFFGPIIVRAIQGKLGG